MTTIRLILLLTAALCLGVLDAFAQERGYTIAVRGAPLDEAIEQFVDATGAAVSYEPALVRGRTTSCAARDASAEDVLRCILRETGIDFHRLSSGTYVLTESVEIAPEHGYVAGRVVDAETGSPIPGAHVMLAEAGAVTDRAGRFTFPSLLPGSYELSVRHIGYRSWRDSLEVRPQEQVIAEADLASEPIVITPVIVDAFSDHSGLEGLEAPQVRSWAPPVGHAGTDVSTYGHIGTVAGVRLNDVTADAHVQGGDPGAHQVRLDGVPVFLPRSLAGLIGPFGSFALDRIRVHRAGFGAAEGSHLGGVLAAEHALGAMNDADLQVDPLSLNGRVRLTADGPTQASVMVAGRLGLWDVGMSRLPATLGEWSRSDPFVLIAPLEGFDAPYTIPEAVPILRSPVNPSLRYSDLHAAGRLRFGPLRSLHASYYQGLQELSGGLLSRQGDLQSGGGFGVLAVVDEYDWTNRLGQVRYDAVLGRRTLASIQARVSRYDLHHRYEAVDSLDVVLADSALQISSVATSPVEEGNRVSLMAVEGTLDHAYERHHLQLGVETGLMHSRFDLRSVHFTAAADESFSEVVARDGRADVETVQLGASNLSDGWYAAAYGEDRIRLSDRLRAEAGVRLTYLHASRTVYAEPRGALLFEGDQGAFGRWSARTSAGLYRQFLNQTDASQLSTGLILSSVRVWLPIDASVRPPVTYHLAQEFLLALSQRWTFRLDGYVKLHPHGLTIAYAPAHSQTALTGIATQSDFLAGTRGKTLGGTAEIAWKGPILQAEAAYSHEHARRESQVLFGGRRHPVPWSEPHRVELALDWTPSDRITVSSRWRGVWNRPWGFRQMYYDYFGHHPETRFHGRFDLGDPAAHTLPPLYQLDVSAAYTVSVGPAHLQLRGEILNVLNRENVLDWRLVRTDNAWQKEARTLYPVMPSLAARIHF